MSSNKGHASRISAASAANAEIWPPTSVLNPRKNHQWTREVVFDFHEVCVKWLDRFVTFVNQLHGYHINPEELRFYNMQLDPSCPLTPEQFENDFVTFARLARGGYGDLEAYPGIKEAMTEIKAQGIKVSIWTWTPGAAESRPDGRSAFNTGIAQRVTTELIAKLGLPVDIDRDVRFMHPGEKKWNMVEEHIPLIVEDNPETAVSVGMGAAHAAILVPTPYNEGITCPNVLRLSNRSELAPTVIDFFAKLDAAGVLL